MSCGIYCNYVFTILISKQTKDALSERKSVEKAKGIIMKTKI